MAGKELKDQKSRSEKYGMPIGCLAKRNCSYMKYLMVHICGMAVVWKMDFSKMERLAFRKGDSLNLFVSEFIQKDKD